jgi:chemotaxis protein histidine kinase CheA/ActR/RegA family two-component response regulator
MIPAMTKTVSQQIKTTFSEESQSYLSELHTQILELDPNLSNFSQQISQLLTTHRGLRVSAIKADFYTQDSPFVLTIDHFDQVINLLSDRISSIDKSTKDLMIAVINMTAQMINEYCFELEKSSDWLELQNNLFMQISISLDLDIHESTINYSKDDEHFNLDKTQEALHLFDIEESSNDLQQNNKESLSNADLFPLIQLNNLQLYNPEALSLDEDLSQAPSEDSKTLFPSLSFNDLESPFDEQFDEQFENLIQSDGVNNKLLLLEPFTHELFTESTLDNDDETKSQGVNWNLREEDIDSPWNKFLSFEPWLELAKTENGGNSETASSTKMTSLEELIPSLDISNSHEFHKLADKKSDYDFEELAEADNAFWDSLEAIKPLRAIAKIDGFEVTIQDGLQVEESFANDRSQLIPITVQNFSTDIDTAIEESPIYQNKAKKSDNSSDDPKLIDSDDQVSITEESTLANTFVNTTSLISKSSKADGYLDVDTELSQQSEYHTFKIDHDKTIRIPLNYLELWEDLSEDLLVRKSNLDIHLGKIRSLSEEAQTNLQLLDPISFNHAEKAIADLQNTLQHLADVLDLTEQKNYAMSQDVRNLRHNFRQVLKYPISSLVRKFPRILRDLSLQHHKQVQLIVQGAEIGIERVLSEIVAETLDLLIRNTFEYSIESSDERQKKGKSLQSKIEVFTTQTDEITIITVSDDGQGLNHLSSDISYLENISKLSDIRRKLLDVGGTITVYSDINKGTQSIVTLPNMISLLRVLLVDIDNICLAISSKVILEVMPMESHHSSTNGEQENLLWRDRVIPVVRLNSLFKLNCQQNVNQLTNQSSNFNLEGSKPASAVPSFLIIQYEHNCFALQTNGCWQEQEATLHQIEGNISLPNLFLGAVILGNNQAIALINHAELINQCLRSHPHIGVLNAQNDDFNFNNSSINNLSSLSKLFGTAYSKQETDISELSDRPVRAFEQSSEPENLESSGIFMSNPSDGHKMQLHQSKVLIVDSSANVRRYLAMTLARSGFLTEQVQDGREAIAFLKERLRNRLDIDLVIADLELPHMDGFKLLTELRADPFLHNLPIVVLTAQNNEKSQKLALEMGANAYFSKPYREQELVRTLQELVSK